MKPKRFEAEFKPIGDQVWEWQLTDSETGETYRSQAIDQATAETAVKSTIADIKVKETSDDNIVVKHYD